VEGTVEEGAAKGEDEGETGGATDDLEKVEEGDRREEEEEEEDEVPSVAWAASRKSSFTNHSFCVSKTVVRSLSLIGTLRRVAFLFLFLLEDVASFNVSEWTRAVFPARESPKKAILCLNGVAMDKLLFYVVGRQGVRKVVVYGVCVDCEVHLEL